MDVALISSLGAWCYDWSVARAVAGARRAGGGWRSAVATGARTSLEDHLNQRKDLGDAF